jgi:uncharacterized protein (DUF2384 family)
MLGNFMKQNNSQQCPEMVVGCVPENLFADPPAFIRAVREGIPGHWLSSIIRSSGLDESIAKALGAPQKQLEVLCDMDVLDTRTSEAVLEIARVLYSCAATWESPVLANQWLKSGVPGLGGESPVSLLDTHEGRRWIIEVLRKIEGGQFS